MTVNPNKALKRQKLRNNEYYDTQQIFDDLYQKSLKNANFTNLMQYVLLDENIKLAYRNIKKNKGSKTAGTDKKTIEHLAAMSEERLLRLVKNRLKRYEPQSVRRVEIPKGNDPTKKRPLGIPTIMDRLIQQCFLQVLEPICEAKFRETSNGFRPNRGVENALAQAERLIQTCNLHIVIDIDIKGFFDNVSHGKLLKQMWSLGIQDKTLISVISAMLKAEVAGIGFPEKGTPQGGIISPLLSNIVLNELDWWIASQWVELPTRHEFYGKIHSNGTKENSKKYRGLRTTKLKECYIVRYADDFKIFCKKHSDAIKLFKATKLWLKDRLGLDISPEKSKIVNLKHNYSEFLGFKLKVHKKGIDKKFKEKRDNYVICSHVSDKALERIHTKAAEHIKNIQLCKSRGETAEYYAVSEYNSYVMGVHNYYKMATCVCADFQPLAYGIKQSIKVRLQERVKRRKNQAIPRYAVTYAKSKEIRFIGKSILLPIGYVKHKPPIHKKKAINKYTAEGRELIHKNLENVDVSMVHALMRNPIKGTSIEYNDNRISLYVAQKGRCAITKEPLSMEAIHCHHKKQKAKGGGDEYANLIILDKQIHQLIHATDSETITLLSSNFKLKKQQIEKLNKLRLLVENEEIVFNAEMETVN